MMDNFTRSNRILIVDDESAIRSSLARYLRENGYHEIDEAENGDQALEYLSRERYFFVITDISMPSITGLELLAAVRRDHPQTDVAVITGHTEIDYAIQALKNGAYEYFRKPFRFDEVLAAIARVRQKQELEQRSIELELLKVRTRSDESHLKELLLALAHIIDMKSPYTREHGDRVAKISALIGKRLGLMRGELDRLSLGGGLHDIGKLGCPDCILDKPGKLTTDEYSIIKEHPGRGADLCAHIHCLEPVLPMIRWHHENLDGSGYPDRLVGSAIPFEARIVRIADYWDAITSKRSYHDPMAFPQAQRVIEEECERNRLDGTVARALFECIADGTLIQVRAARSPSFALHTEL